ncbi:hypothetical protein [Ereboglobus luteus]|uniref:hypothetical protein n=1 Tax=Ereboglobus luteus TaxID=1796921 RepID=UPI0012601BFC|nr:hypothetical protein [Ereboglobus luteus]
MRTFFIFISLFLITAGCVAQTSDKKTPDMIMLSYEGVPRAHIPTIVWFEGEILPVVAVEEEHDAFW